VEWTWLLGKFNSLIQAALVLCPFFTTEEVNTALGSAPIFLAASRFLLFCSSLRPTLPHSKPNCFSKYYEALCHALPQEGNMLTCSARYFSPTGIFLLHLAFFLLTFAR
jgi:hypothetical protein